MKAMVLRAPRPAEENPLREEDVPLPSPAPGEILLRVHTCGVCHTDLHIVEGDLKLPRLPIIPGHQVIGTVQSAGSGVKKFRPGDTVGVPWLHSTCRQCEYCRNGFENLCDNATFTGYDVNGGFAEYMVAAADFSYMIPVGFPNPEAAPLLCAGIIGYRALRLSEAQSGQVLGLYGFGASAHITIQIARHSGIETYVFSRSRDHRKHAEELGAAWTGGAEDIPEKRLHAAIIFAPAGGLVPQALRVLRKGGTLALAGIHMSPIPQFEYSLLYGERKIRSVSNSTRKDAEDLLQLAAAIPISTEIETYSLHEANEVLKRLKQAKVHGAAVLEITK